MVNLAKIQVPHPFRSDRAGQLAFVPRLARAGREPWALGLRTSKLDSGFTLLELLIVMVIIATLAAMAIPMFTRNVLAAKEAVLREDLQVMRTAIGSYTVDKQKAPQALDDLVTAGYLKAIPKEPISGRTDCWVTSQSDALSSVDQTDSGIDDVHTCTQATALDGTSYSSW
jgi:general secretion pathway protein G